MTAYITKVSIHCNPEWVSKNCTIVTLFGASKIFKAPTCCIASDCLIRKLWEMPSESVLHICKQGARMFARIPLSIQDFLADSQCLSLRSHSGKPNLGSTVQWKAREMSECRTKRRSRASSIPTHSGVTESSSPLVQPGQANQNNLFKSVPSAAQLCTSCCFREAAKHKKWPFTPQIQEPTSSPLLANISMDLS